MSTSETKLYVYNPAAAGVSVRDGNVYLEGNNLTPIPPNCFSSCSIRCKTAATKKVITITFQNIEFGDCQDCGKNLNLKFTIPRSYFGDVGTSIGNNWHHYAYLPESLLRQGTVTAAALATAFAQSINNDRLDFLGAAAVATGANLVLTFQENHDTNVFIEQSGLLTSELPAVVVTTPMVASSLDADDILTEKPLLANFLPGGAPVDYWSNCRSLCIITLYEDLLRDGCWPEVPISGLTRHYEIWVDTTDTTNYNAWLAALKAAIPKCATGIP